MELFHVLNRGVEKRSIFEDDRDRARFIHNLYEFNDVKPAGNAYKKFSGMSTSNMDIVSPSLREPIIDVHGWCLMGNHYHLLLSERTEGGLTKFVRKLNIGYAKYFNERHRRSGFLFQGRTKKVLIKTDAHLQYIIHYLHLNPLDFLADASDWRIGRIKNAEVALRHLDCYRWSSFNDYCGKKNFPSLLTTELFADLYNNYRDELESYVRDMEYIPPELTLE